MPINSGQVFQLFQNILCTVDQLSALLNEVVTPLRDGGVNGAGYGKHLFAQVQCLLGGNQRARTRCGFDHQAALRQASDQAIALWEIGGEGRRVQWVLADQQAMRRNL